MKDKELLSVSNSVLLGSIIIAAAIVYSGSAGGLATKTAANPGGNPNAPVKLALKSDVPYLGNDKAKVVVVEYADYQCPFCEKWYTETMTQLKPKYIDTGKIKFIYQDFAFLGSDSNTLAEGSHCAQEQGKFWEYHDYIFSHQGRENSGWGTVAKVKTLATNVSGLDAAKFGQCLDSGKYKQQVQDETNAGKAAGVTGTPTVFINGEKLVGAVPFSTLEATIQKYVK